MLRIRRTTVAAVAATALLATPLATATAEAAPHGGRGHSAAAAKAGQSTRGVLREIAAKDRYLARLVTSRAVTRLPDAQEPTVVASIAADRATLTALTDAVTAGTTTARDARTQLRAFRVETYRVVVAVLGQAAAITAQAPDDAAVAAAVDSAVTAALGLHATSTRAEVRTVLGLLDAAWALVDAGGTDDPQG